MQAKNLRQSLVIAVRSETFLTIAKPDAGLVADTEKTMDLLLYIIAAFIVVVLFMQFKRVTILEYERGILYKKGRFKRVLEPGQYWLYKHSTSIEKVDTRPRYVTINGQEVLSSDGLALKVSLAAEYQVVDPNVAINQVENYNTSAYLAVQFALRDIVGGANLEDILEKRAGLNSQMLQAASPGLEPLGLKLVSVNIKDIMLPAELKRSFSQVIKARKEGQAALEKARGETAALRNLANAAKMLEDNPSLLQLRVLQQLGEPSGNTFVVGVPGVTPVSNSRKTDAASSGPGTPDGD